MLLNATQKIFKKDYPLIFYNKKKNCYKFCYKNSYKLNVAEMSTLAEEVMRIRVSIRMLINTLLLRFQRKY